MEIALFGTSADPPTTGHQSILRWLADRFDYVAVWAADNPFKQHQTPLRHRSTMLRLLVEEVLDELQRSLPSVWLSRSGFLPHRPAIGLHPELSSPRTLITLQRARQTWPRARFTLVIGADLVPQLPRWYQIEQLLQQARLLIIPRKGYSLDSKALEQLRQLGAEVAIADLTVPATSSTAYRESRDHDALTNTVEAYIHREQLYECHDATAEKAPLQER